MADQKFKSKVKLQGGVSLPQQTPSKALTIDANGDIVSSAVSDVELGHLAGVTSPVQTQIDDAVADAAAAQAAAVAAQDAADAAQLAIDDHIADASDAHDASAISSIPSGNLAATDVQAALNELQSDIDTRATSASLTAHIDDTADAHDASAISVVPSGNLAATDVQAALSELQSDIDSRIASSEKGVANGVATLDASGKVPVSQLPNAIMEYQGVWDASTNTPSLANGAGNADEAIGNVYRVSVAGTVDFGAGNITFVVGDYAILNSSKIWEKADTTDAVSSVFGRTGDVSAQSGDYTASQITNVPAGSISATDVQAAINELDSEKAAVGHTHVAADITDFSEAAQDAVGSILVDSDTIDLTYTDGTPEIKADVKVQQSITSDASGIKLVGDAATPGSSKYYGTDGSGTKGFHDLPTGGSANDIQEASISIANNQTTAANVTGLLLASNVRSFKVLLSVEIDATLDLFETIELVGIQKASSFEMAQSGVGDESGIVLTITSGGQIQYTSANYAGFVSGVIRFRAITTSF